MGYEELEASGLRVSLFPGSPPLFVREQNFAIGILVARAEHSKLVETPPPSAQSMEERCRRAGLAYAGICHILAVAGNTRVPTMVSVCFIAAHASPYIAFGSSIAKKPGSSAKERLRRLRHDELQTAYPTIKFFAGLKKAGAEPGYCAEVPCLLQLSSDPASKHPRVLSRLQGDKLAPDESVHAPTPVDRCTGRPQPRSSPPAAPRRTRL
ncbi:hypothetical protein C8J57DRAFT_1465768 [Mycena rebaudengoi]|nr:hypothetical protein C8J57DRAFT_1465768 [Mycena rebaudengoi]